MTGFRLSSRFIPRRLRRVNVHPLERETLIGSRIPSVESISALATEEYGDVVTELEWSLGIVFST